MRYSKSDYYYYEGDYQATVDCIEMGAEWTIETANSIDSRCAYNRGYKNRVERLKVNNNEN